MINRLVYEVRLFDKKTPKGWRWDVGYYITTDPEFPGVETGREGVGHVWGYEKYRWLAVRKIRKNILNNPYKEIYTVR